MFTLVKYFKPNCTPCKLMEKVIQDFIAKEDENIELKNINVNELSTEEYKAAKLKTVPTMKLFVEKELIGIHVGSAQLSQFEKWFNDTVVHYLS